MRGGCVCVEGGIPLTSELFLMVYRQVELLDFQGEMLTEDGGIMRRIKTKGEGFTNPNDGATVDGRPFLVFNPPQKYMLRCFPSASANNASVNG